MTSFTLGLSDGSLVAWDGRTITRAVVAAVAPYGPRPLRTLADVDHSAAMVACGRLEAAIQDVARTL